MNQQLKKELFDLKNQCENLKNQFDLLKSQKPDQIIQQPVEQKCNHEREIKWLNDQLYEYKANLKISEAESKEKDRDIDSLNREIQELRQFVKSEREKIKYMGLQATIDDVIDMRDDYHQLIEQHD